jgi:phosphatidylglycerol---prolipoprotein diacylglyceryl transferase
MLTHPQIDPVIVEIGPIAIRWYGLMYLLGFLAAWLVIRHLAKRRGSPLTGEALSDLLFHAIIGLLLGARLGYSLFYNFSYYLSHPLKILAVWEGGMSFHGGLLGVIVAVLLYVRRHRLPLLQTGDLLVAAAPIGLGLGRLGNFINGELWGRVTDVPWGMVFPGAGPYPRHASQLYEALLEGLVLFLILWQLHRRNAPAGVPLSCFFLFYGIFRFAVEFYRQPDAHLGFLWAGATMGQLLSLPMILAGGAGLVILHFRSKRP